MIIMPIRVRVGQAPAVKVVSSLSGSKTINLSGLNDVSAKLDILNFGINCFNIEKD